MVITCPLCNQPMEGVDPQDYGGFNDLYICGACQIEQAVYWETGERVILHNDDEN